MRLYFGFRPKSGADVRTAVTRNEQTARQIHLHRGCYPMFYDQPRPESDEGWQTDVRPARILFAAKY